MQMGESGDRRSGRLRFALLVVLGAIFVVAGLAFIAPDVLSQADYEEVAVRVKKGDGIDWDKLRKINGDVVAWVRVARTSIDYPVCQSDDNSYYLSHDLRGRYGYGGVFIDHRADADGRNCIVYGHHLVTGKMFSPIHDAWEQGSFDGIGTVTWSTPVKGTVRLKPIAAKRVYEDYAHVQRFEFKATEERVGKLLSGEVSAASRIKLGNGESLLEQTRERAADEEYRSWLRQLCSGATARCDDLERQVNGSERAVILVSCSSGLARQPWRTLLICSGR